MIVKHMIKFKKIVLELKIEILDKVWEILDTLKRQATEEDFRMREKILDSTLPICFVEEKSLLLNLVKPHLRSKMRTLHLMNKEYELISKEIEKAFEKVFLEQRMKPMFVPISQVPSKQDNVAETIMEQSTGPQDSAPVVKVQTKVDKFAPMTKSLKDSTIIIDNVEIAMAATDTNLDKFEEAFVSTQEAKILCSTPPVV